jgi:hypothetical protein
VRAGDAIEPAIVLGGESGPVAQKTNSKRRSADRARLLPVTLLQML